MIESALNYARHGRPIFPCGTDKRPLTPSGFKDASADLQQVKDWWTAHPGASIGVPTGEVSGFFVLDVDLPEGPEALAHLEAEHGPLPATREQRTGSGGRHLLFKTPGYPIRNSARKLGSGLDVRGDGGYIIAPPSAHPSGQRYEWVTKHPIAEAPQWLLDLLEDPKPKQQRSQAVGNLGQYGQKALAVELADLSGAQPGSRNHRLNQAAFSLGQLVAGGELDGSQVYAALLGAAAGVGLPMKEAERTIESGLAAGMGDPRKAPDERGRPDCDSATEKLAQGEEMPQTEIISKLRRGSDIKGLDIKVEWHVEPLLPKGAVTLFFGRGGFGKSTLMIQIGGALASGGSIFGMQATAAPVVYVDYENSLAILSKRLQDIDADDVLFLDSTGTPPRLDKPERNLYFDILAAHPGAVFIFDTLRSAQSSDENDSRVMADVMGYLRLLRDRGATVIVLHHTPKSSDRKYKGSGAIFDMADHILGLYPVKQAGDDAEADEDEDEARVFRFGTAMKTRFEPSRLFLTFNPESRCFELAPDPAEQELADLAAIISGIGLDAKQGDILAAAQDEGLSQKKTLSLLSKGEGRLWNKRRGLNNAKLFTLTENGLAVLQPYIGAKNRKTEIGSSEPSAKPTTLADHQSHIDSGFVGFAGVGCQTEKQTATATAGNLPSFDW